MEAMFSLSCHLQATAFSITRKKQYSLSFPGTCLQQGFLTRSTPSCRPRRSRRPPPRLSAVSSMMPAGGDDKEKEKKTRGRDASPDDPTRAMRENSPFNFAFLLQALLGGECKVTQTGSSTEPQPPEVGGEHGYIEGLHYVSWLLGQRKHEMAEKYCEDHLLKKAPPTDARPRFLLAVAKVMLMLDKAHEAEAALKNFYEIYKAWQVPIEGEEKDCEMR